MAAEIISLVGYRGCGKTTVGRLLAVRLGWSFVDADEVLAARCGQTISAFIAARGWDEFRRLESEILAELTRSRRLVLATGGGVVLKAENRCLLKKSGPVVWLEAGLAETLNRLLADPVSADQRPPLRREHEYDPRAAIAGDLAEREPLYREVAEVKIVVDRRRPEEIVAEIIESAAISGLDGRRP